MYVHVPTCENVDMFYLYYDIYRRTHTHTKEICLIKEHVCSTGMGVWAQTFLSWEKCSDVSLIQVSSSIPNISSVYIHTLHT